MHHLKTNRCYYNKNILLILLVFGSFGCVSNSSNGSVSIFFSEDANTETAFVTDKGLMCAEVGVDKGPPEYLIIHNERNKDYFKNPNSLEATIEIISVSQHGVCGWVKHDAKITGSGLLFFQDYFADCLDGECWRTLRSMFTLDKDSYILKHLASSKFDKSDSQDLSTSAIFQDIDSYIRSPATYKCEVASPSFVKDFVKYNMKEGIGKMDEKMDGEDETYKEFYCPNN